MKLQTRLHILPDLQCPSARLASLFSTRFSFDCESGCGALAIGVIVVR
jgi:hypothetical protein